MGLCIQQAKLGNTFVDPICGRLVQETEQAALAEEANVLISDGIPVYGSFTHMWGYHG